MAARNKIWTPDKVRERIQTSMIANRLADHALGKNKMTSTQVRAAEILLRKTIPDLSSTELKAELTHHHEITDEAMSPDEWEAQYAAEDDIGLGSAGRSAKSLN